MPFNLNNGTYRICNFNFQEKELMERFNKQNYHTLCDGLARMDKEMDGILKLYGYPPLWVRPNSFETIVLTILEQQVSLASAYAAYKKLKEKIEEVTPEAVLQLSDEELRSCYFSRQKIGYVRGLAEALITKKLDLMAFTRQPDDAVRTRLKELKGIGDWTVDIYLIHALQRTDIFPLGDLALVNALRDIKGLPKDTPKENLLSIAEPWKPYRTIATMMLWHYYIKKRNIKLLH